MSSDKCKVGLIEHAEVQPCKQGVLTTDDGSPLVLLSSFPHSGYLIIRARITAVELSGEITDRYGGKHGLRLPTG